MVFTDYITWTNFFQILKYGFGIIGVIVTIKEFYAAFLEKKFRNFKFWIGDVDIKIIFTKRIYLKDSFNIKNFKEVVSLLEPNLSGLNYRNFEPHLNYINLSFQGSATTLRISYLQDSENGKILKIQTISDIVVGYRKFRDFDSIISKLSSLYGTLEKVNTEIIESDIVTNIEIEIDNVSSEAYTFELDKYNAKVTIKNSKFTIVTKSLVSMKEIIKASIRKWNAIR